MKFDSGHRKIFGTVSVNDKGQIVIPAEARKEFGIEPDTKLMVFGWGCGSRKALFLMHTDDFEKRLGGFWGSFFRNSASSQTD